MTFHQERVLNGVLAYRDSITGPWIAYTAEELTEKLQDIQSQTQAEIAASFKEFADTSVASIQAAVKQETERILRIVESEPEPGWGTILTTEQETQLNMVSRPVLANVVTKVTKQSITQRILAS